jgi:hypothetical protein
LLFLVEIGLHEAEWFFHVAQLNLQLILLMMLLLESFVEIFENVFEELFSRVDVLEN